MDAHQTTQGGPPATPIGPESVHEVVWKAFPRCRSTTRRQLVAYADIRSYRAGETVVEQGDEDRTALVLYGHVGIRRTTLDGREVIPTVVSAGELAALMSIAHRPSAAEAVALSPCQVALLPGNEVQALAAGDAGLALDLLEHVLRIWEAVVERLDGLLYQNSLRRVARVLDQHAAIFFGEPPVARSHLPALVGTSREMTGRVLRSLEADGVVARVGRDKLRLLDAARLTRLATTPASADEDRRNKFLAKGRPPLAE